MTFCINHCQMWYTDVFAKSSVHPTFHLVSWISRVKRREGLAYTVLKIRQYAKVSRSLALECHHFSRLPTGTGDNSRRRRRRRDFTVQHAHHVIPHTIYKFSGGTWFSASCSVDAAEGHGPHVTWGIYRSATVTSNICCYCCLFRGYEIIFTNNDEITYYFRMLTHRGRGHLNCLNARYRFFNNFNPLNAELNPFCYLLALLAHHFLHVSRIKVKSLTLRLIMSYIYIIYLFTACPITFGNTTCNIYIWHQKPKG